MKKGKGGSSASSFWSWLLPWVGDRNYECPYCFPLQKLDKRNDHQYICPSCEVTFDNELEPIIPINYDDSSQEVPLTRQTCIPLEQGKLSFENAFTSNDILCRTCHNHQNILLQLLASSDAETPQQIRAYKDELERRYPLCSACRGRVQERLRLLQYKLTSRRLGGSGPAMKKDKITTITAADRSRSTKWLFAFIDTFIIQSAFCIVYYFDDAEGIQLGAIAAVAFMTLASVVTYWGSSIVAVVFALMLGFLRIALLASINEHTEDSDYLSNPMYLLFFACLVLLYQLHYSRTSTSTKKLQKTPSIIKEHANGNQMDGYHFASTNWSRSIDEIPVTPVSVAKGGGASGSEDITLKLNSALESLGPTTPLTTRFTDLPSSAKTTTSVIRNSPFAVPPSVLTATTQEKKATTFSSFASSKSAIGSKMPTPRPSRLPHDFDSGLEGVMAGFSLRESPQSPKSFQSSQRYENPFLISFAFIFVRLFLHAQHGTISLLLLLSAALRDVNWHRCPTWLKAAINCLFVVRLCWLVLILNADMIQSLVPPLLYQKHFFGELALDFIILASR